MLGNTLIIDAGGVNVTTIKINQDQYSSEYLKRITGGEWKVRVRHTKVGGKNGTLQYDRHNVEVVKTVFATESEPEFYRKAYLVFEHLPKDTTPIECVEALCETAIATSSALLTSLSQWES